MVADSDGKFKESFISRKHRSYLYIRLGRRKRDFCVLITKLYNSLYN